MKYLIIIILGVILFSCSEEKHNQIDVTEKLPIEVVNLKDANKFDTLYSISTNDKTFVFNKDIDYLGAFDNNKDLGIYKYAVIVTGLLIIVLFILLMINIID